MKQQQLDGGRGQGAGRGRGARGREPAEKTAHVKGIEDDLRQRLAVRVEIKVKAKEKGQIVIGFETNDDFERIVSALTK